jgi:hypothetical protein
MARSSTSKIRVELAGITGGKPRSLLERSEDELAIDQEVRGERRSGVSTHPYAKSGVQVKFAF